MTKLNKKVIYVVSVDSDIVLCMYNYDMEDWCFVGLSDEAGENGNSACGYVRAVSGSIDALEEKFDTYVIDTIIPNGISESGMPFVMEKSDLQEGWGVRLRDGSLGTVVKDRIISEHLSIYELVDYTDNMERSGDDDVLEVYASYEGFSEFNTKTYSNSFVKVWTRMEHEQEEPIFDEVMSVEDQIAEFFENELLHFKESFNNLSDEVKAEIVKYANDLDETLLFNYLHGVAGVMLGQGTE